MNANLIGEYLRARRELIQPHDVGIPDSGRRRVAGLRRDERAMLAGVSTEYYTRLEQGSDRHPSTQVLDAIARALRLDADATAHLHDLATPPSPRRQKPPRPEHVSASVLQLIEMWPNNPAAVHGRHFDILAVNPLLAAVSPIFTPGRNILRAAFLEEATTDLIGDTHVQFEDLVSALRASAGADVDDPQLAALVGELSLKSAEFRRLWAHHDVKPFTGRGVHRIRHPLVGDLELSYDKFLIVGADRQMLTVYCAEAGSSTEQALRLLSSMIAEPSTDADASATLEDRCDRPAR